MRVQIHKDKQALGKLAAEEGAAAIRVAIAEKGHAAIIVATGASQFEMIDVLVESDVNWSCVTVFHLDEYVGLGIDHPASFRRYLQERFVERVSGLKEFVPVNADAEDLDAEMLALGQRIAQESIDVCFAGIGENCHLAFNDPPADFETKLPYIVVELDEDCRRQQMGEGWFSSLEEVPKRAVSMSIRQIMASSKIILSVPDERKARAVKNALEGQVSNRFPASIVQEHADTVMHLDQASASLLSA
ncbi:glucosamine-6-phosphate deaminase [Granulosicoccus antarcticus]|uniref:Glucosamine-6-phosphate deaminase 1 n=1 Tax=Granulosicoccus antarcticus IMCC3135 TaxID=1192854 RepID=A0A2Z2NT03_9GAMM|nr:glucosamine-6-phosphate deaminase [Granulosicoccus antarcticus]ASJ72868.1 Glucosamine-6-phosphate deaminase 1 [Granulosicoccus antarcticus IMCC3135]